MLLYHNPRLNRTTRKSYNNSPLTILEQLQKDIIPLQQQGILENRDDSTDSPQRQQAMAHIEKLVQEISISEKSGDLSRHRIMAINELLGEQKQQDLHTVNEPHQKSIPADEKIDNSKPPLDVYELQTIAAMAKKLRASSSHRLINKSQE